jgi:AcrR family transcriptional regulator
VLKLRLIKGLRLKPSTTKAPGARGKARKAPVAAGRASRLTSALKTRAKSDEAKNDVRAAFIAAGRTLLSKDGSTEASLRSIATAAGYSPGAIYQYFSDHRELLMAIREEDMLTAVVTFEAIAARETNPERRVKEVFLGVARYWLENFDHYQVLFSLPPNKPPIRDRDGVPFGRSPVVIRSYSLYDRIVRELFETYDHPPVPGKRAVDTIIAAVHGIVAFPRHTRTMDWTDTLVMAELAIDALLHLWRTNGRQQIP